jgi:biotin carboxylase
MTTSLNKTILIIGAGDAQLGGIRKAREMGCRVIAVDGNPSAPGLAEADLGKALDIMDFTKIIELAREQHIDAAMAIASEICLPTVARVNDALGLKGMTLNQAVLMTDKGAMRYAYGKAGVPGPKYAIFSQAGELLDASVKTGFPAVLKPVDSAGSRGVSYVACAEELNIAFSKARNYSRCGRFILEEFMPGIEVSVEAFVCNGKISILTLSDKHRTEPPYLLDTAVMFPSSHTREMQEEIKAVAIKAIKALGIDNCPIHMEQMVTPDGPKVVEMAARGPGFKVFTEIIPFVTGVDVLGAQIQLPFAKNITLHPVLPLKGACIRFFAGKNGIVKKISGTEKARKLPGVHDLQIYVKPGDKASELTSGPDRLGHVITFADTRSQACELADRIFAMIEIEIE